MYLISANSSSAEFKITCFLSDIISFSSSVSKFSDGKLAVAKNKVNLKKNPSSNKLCSHHFRNLKLYNKRITCDILN